MTQTLTLCRTDNGLLALPAMQRQVETWLEYRVGRGRVKSEDLGRAGRRAMDSGRRACDGVVRKYGTRVPIELARRLEVAVLRESANGTHGPLAVIAEYRAAPPAIVLHEPVLSACGRAVRQAGELPQTAADRFEDICVAHELFHHLERTGRYGCSLATGQVPRKLRVSAREAAAHAFAAFLLHLDFMPCILEDYAAPALYQANDVADTKGLFAIN